MEKHKFYPCRVIRVVKETQDCVSLELQVDDDIKELFSFKAGQYLTFRHFDGGKEIRRSYSICTAPHENKLKVAVKKVKDGLFSSFANDNLEEGSMLEVMPPQGLFLCKNHFDRTQYVFFAAGSGITPVIGMIKDILYRTDREIVLFYGNRSTDTIIFREEIESLKSKHLGRFSVHHILSSEKLGSPLFFGRIDRNKCENYLKMLIADQEVIQYLICGPYDMIFDIEQTLLDYGVEKSRISYELFTTQDKREKSIYSEKPKHDNFISLIQIKMDGVISELELTRNGLSILDAAIHAGADLPYSCKGGVCSTCKARLVEGEIKMDVCYALEEDEIANGYILTCQSHPVTDRVIIDFDEN